MFGYQVGTTHQHPFPSKKLGGSTFYTLLMIAAQFANLRTATLRKNECHQRVQRAEFVLGEPKGELGNATPP